MEPRLPRGMRDILPEQMLLRRYVIRTFEEIFEAYGFEPLQTPALELRETLMGKYGPDAEKLIYDARHREGKEELSLRYDLSVPLARVVATYPSLPRPFKRYQIAPVWRAERPQKGRYREFYQCDADIAGASSMAADAEIIALIHEALTRLGFRDFVILLNDRKLLAGLGRYSGVPEPLLGSLYRAIDKFDRLGLEGVQEEMRRYGIPEEAIARMLELLRIEGDHAEILEGLSRRMQAAEIPEGLEGIRELETLLRFVEAMGVPSERYRISSTMVRGLEYYTGPIFETVVTEPKIGSITGGGRYDGLVGPVRQAERADDRDQLRHRADHRCDSGAGDGPAGTGSHAGAGPGDHLRRAPLGGLHRPRPGLPPGRAEGDALLRAPPLRGPVALRPSEGHPLRGHPRPGRGSPGRGHHPGHGERGTTDVAS
jgi:histidyl-tRNA synthetase